MVRAGKHQRTLVKFGDVVRNANLVERDAAAAGLKRIVGLEHMEPENLHIRRWDSPGDASSFSRKFVQGQTLFGKRRAYQRKVAFAEFDGICSGDILTFEPVDPKILLPELLPFICKTDKFFDYALGTSAGSLSPRTSWGALKNFEFPLPPLAEQKRLAEILWAADEAASHIEHIWRDANVLLDSMRTECFGTGQHVRRHLRPALKAIVAGKSVVGASSPAGVGEYGVLKVSAVGPDGFQPSENKRLLDASLFVTRFGVKKDSLLMTRCNTAELVGRVCWTTQDYPNLMLCDKTLQLVVNDEMAEPRFIFEMLRSRDMRRQLIGCATGTGGAMKNITQEDIHALRVPLPSLNVQRQIAATMTAVRNGAAAAGNHVANLRQIALILVNGIFDFRRGIDV